MRKMGLSFLGRTRSRQKGHSCLSGSTRSQQALQQTCPHGDTWKSLAVGSLQIWQITAGPGVA
jgi:hypothetical protein